jgi:predicted DNA-binding transcriptional regulator YafY
VSESQGQRGRLTRRLAALLRYTSGRRYMPPMKVLARGLNGSHRTLYRDFAALEEMGWELPKRVNDDQLAE